MKVRLNNIILKSIFAILAFMPAIGCRESFKESALLSVISQGDSKKSLEPVEYVKWIENPENGLKVEKPIGDYQFTLLYKPLEYIVLKEAKQLEIKKSELKKGVEEISDFDYFTFQIGTVKNVEDVLKFGVNTNEEFQKRVDYFSFRMQNDLKLVDGKDTLQCSLFHFERTFGIAPYCTFVLGFEKGGKELKNKTLIYNDEILGLGPVKLMIQAENLNNIPQLITQN